MLGDSGGFQIAKGLWEGDWKANSGCPKAQKRREAVVKWLDGICDYGMTLDIPNLKDFDARLREEAAEPTLEVPQGAPTKKVPCRYMPARMACHRPKWRAG